MSNTPSVFTFTAQAVRVVTDEHNNPWFAVADVCDVLGYANSRDALAKHCRADGVAKRDTIDNMGRTQPLTFINEGNLYRLIIKSRKPEAEKFEAWVCDEVLPTIRKTGKYEVQAAPPMPVKLGQIGEWLTKQYHQHSARYLTRSSAATAFALRAGIEARFGAPARDLAPAQLPALLDELERFGDDCYRIWQVTRQIEIMLLEQWKNPGQKLPEFVQAMMDRESVPNGEETVLRLIRRDVRAMLPGVVH